MFLENEKDHTIVVSLSFFDYFLFTIQIGLFIAVLMVTIKYYQQIQTVV